MGMGEDAGVDEVQAARDLLARFLAGRGERTLQAYSTDLEDFARFVGVDAAAAVAQLLSDRPGAGRRLVLEYVVALRYLGRAPATIDRRLSTLRALTRLARESGRTTWSFEAPDDDEVAAALESRGSGDVPYLLPRHASEVDRLDVQHFALRETIGGNHVAPIGPLRRALDVGCGTGQWAFELCQRHPDALVVGLDLIPSKTPQPAGYRWVKANLLHGLPFAGDQFDFVYQRLLLVGVPLASWPEAVAELVRVTRPGGWVELVEPIFGVRDAGPAVGRFNELAYAIAAGKGFDVGRVVYDSLDGYLRDAGLEDVTRQETSLPIGTWGGRVGSFLATDMRATQTRFSAVLQARLGISEEECRDLVQRAQAECEQRHMSCMFAIAYGRKPERG
jgi:SAM-dependent methyltransferase